MRDETTSDAAAAENGSVPVLGTPIDFDIRRVARSLPRVEAPEGWVKKVDRSGRKVWVGYFHMWEMTPDGRRVRHKKEKTLGRADRPKHEALRDLADYITQRTGKLAKKDDPIATFAELWAMFCAVKSGQWSKKTKENIQCMFARHVIPEIGPQPIQAVTMTTLQLLLNRLAERRFSKSVLAHIRIYIKSCFEYAVEEDLLRKNPARRVLMPKVRKKPCERFLSIEEVRALLAVAPPQEHLVLRLLGVCGLRPAEMLALRVEDFTGSELRIDEALKERQSGEDRIGETKTEESDSFVPVPPDLGREIAEWIASLPAPAGPRDFLFSNSAGNPFGVVNYLKRRLKPLAKLAGVPNVTFQAFRRTSSTHMQKYATVKDMQRHLRHSDPQTTLKHYAKVIPESLRTAIAALDGEIVGKSAKGK